MQEIQSSYQTASLTRLIRWSLTLGWTLFIVILLLRPGDPPPPGVSYTNRIDDSTLGHVIVFGAMFFLWWGALVMHIRHWSALIAALSIVLLIGTFGELAQWWFVPYRGASIYDWLGNLIGAGIAYGGIRALRRFSHKTER